MNASLRFFLGAAGALAPSAVNFLVVDVQIVFGSLTLIVLTFYGLRLALLSTIGGLWAYFERDESVPAKLFRLGIVAPAMIVALVNGTNVERAQARMPWEAVAHAQYAFAVCVQAKAKVFTPPAPTAYEQIQQGLAGRASQRTWFVIVGLHKTVEAARAQVRYTASLQRPGWSAVLYCAPDRRHPYTPFAVVVGEHLDLAGAEARLKEALGAGFLHASLFDLAEKY
ncbi:MAG: hypothetical protein ACRDHY_15535 [Anaerolineales bacterium]